MTDNSGLTEQFNIDWIVNPFIFSFYSRMCHNRKLDIYDIGVLVKIRNAILFIESKDQHDHDFHFEPRKKKNVRDRIISDMLPYLCKDVFGTYGDLDVLNSSVETSIYMDFLRDAIRSCFNSSFNSSQFVYVPFYYALDSSNSYGYEVIPKRNDVVSFRSADLINLDPSLKMDEAYCEALKFNYPLKMIVDINDMFISDTFILQYQFEYLYEDYLPDNYLSRNGMHNALITIPDIVKSSITIQKDIEIYFRTKKGITIQNNQNYMLRLISGGLINVWQIRAICEGYNLSVFDLLKFDDDSTVTKKGKQKLLKGSALARQRYIKDHPKWRSLCSGGLHDCPSIVGNSLRYDRNSLIFCNPIEAVCLCYEPDHMKDILNEYLTIGDIDDTSNPENSDIYDDIKLQTRKRR
jgi:hypothetical protein